MPHLSRTRWALASLALALVFTAGCLPPQPTQATGQASASSPEATALALVNTERARAGVPALAVSSGATAVAEQWSAQMAGAKRLSHNPNLAGSLAANGVTGWRTAAENVGYGASVESVHQMFMQSPGHRANILNRAVTQAGVGVVVANGTTWVTIVFFG